MKKLYSLFALGAVLFAACSDNASPVSGSTSVPNMGNNLNNLRSPVLCSVAGVKDSLEAVEKGCIWSPTMWNRTSGYRARTGVDNGTNTSGIWTWHVDQGVYNNIRFEWPGVATDQYDSMALADVIDKCGGSLCGKVVREPNEDKIDSAMKYIEDDGQAYAEFYFVGKDSLGNIEYIDARAMQGFCVEYSGKISVDLLTSDSVAVLSNSYVWTYTLPYSRNPDNSQPEIKKKCFSWGDMGWYTYVPLYQKKPEIAYESYEYILTHVIGLRFTFDYDALYNDLNNEFSIIGIDWFHWTDVSLTDFHPEAETCEPIGVVTSYCDCDFTEEKAIYEAIARSNAFFANKKNRVEENITSLSNLTKECLKNTLDSLNNLRDMKQEMSGSLYFPYAPCDDPHPLAFACADGTQSVTIEFYEKYGEYMDKVEKPLEEKMNASADSLFNYCMSLNN
jgi:hypothetical protein